MALFSILLTTLLYLGCTLYPWSTLGTIRWVQTVSLLNPLTYVSEGFRAAVTPADHLGLYVVYPVLLGRTAPLLGREVHHFRRRVVGRVGWVRTAGPWTTGNPGPVGGRGLS
ncbi:hypothetical protein ACIRL2_09265 [Embleya sp. NPDC127516]|uniref:hypothetical protein n=1 Tax=Embleya sp. NPDC127516 TaxID=3363990 RepID=UPI00382593AA